MNHPVCHVTEIGARAEHGEVILSVRLHGEAGFDFVLDDATANKLKREFIAAALKAENEKEGMR